jgi:hypothetical protein
MTHLTLGDWLLVAILLVPVVFAALRLDARSRPGGGKTDVVELCVDLGWDSEAVYTLAPPIDCPACAARLLKVDVVRYPNQDLTVSCPHCDERLPVSRVEIHGGLTFLEVVS